MFVTQTNNARCDTIFFFSSFHKELEGKKGFVAWKCVLSYLKMALSERKFRIKLKGNETQTVVIVVLFKGMSFLFNFVNSLTFSNGFLLNFSYICTCSLSARG